jgi:hypothetical protein
MSVFRDVTDCLLIPLSAIPGSEPCCDETRERNYRRGYYDGWLSAMSQLEDHLPGGVNDNLWSFLRNKLLPWKSAANKKDTGQPYFPPSFHARPNAARQHAGIKLNLRYRILKRDAFRCQLCGVCSNDGAHIRLEVDHKIARSNGGTDDPQNLWTLCFECNHGKGVHPL